MGSGDSPSEIKDKSPTDEQTIWQFIQDVLELDVMQSERMAKKEKRIKKPMAPPVGKRRKEVCFFEENPKDQDGVDKVLKPLVVSIGVFFR